MQPANLKLGTVLWLSVSLLVGGCSIPMPQAQADPTKIYVLSSTAGAAKPAESGGPALRVRAIEIASYLRTQPLIVRRGENEIEFREFARWGEPLEQGIARVLREGLLASGKVRAVQTAGARVTGVDEPKFELSIRVLAAEGAADGAVRFHAVWELIGLGEAPQAVSSGSYQATDLRWTPKSEATLAAGLSRAVAGLASEVAAKLPQP